jgi:TPR repeat protein
MTALDREKQYIRKWRPKAVRGDSIAMSNVAAAYRILGNFRFAARWYRRASEHGDGDALTEWGYCLQHGVGIRKDDRAAERAYRAAIESKWITDYCREEAMYHLAVLLLGRRSAASRRAAARLLRVASADGDYPQAEALLQIVKSADVRDICVCRRHLRPRLARRHCPMHGPHRGQQNGSANRSQPVRFGTNSTSSAAGSGR